MNQHPRLNDKGLAVTIKQPSTPSPADAWRDPQATATATPDYPMPEILNDVPLAPWTDAPVDHAGWEALGARTTFTEPSMPTAKGKNPAAGVVTVEPDGRVWVVAPTDRFGGYRHTFPKGKLDGLSTRASAIKEAWEESGLRVELTGYLCDSVRSTSVTRYYLARRVGGSPADMGWESQAVMLVPASKLGTVANHHNDQAVVQAVLAYIQGA